MKFLNVVEIESALIGLAGAYPDVAELIALPFVTAEGRHSHALRIGSKRCYRGAVLIIGGVHAREWGGPDICVNFAADLLEAWSGGTGLVYGGTSFSAEQIESIINGLDVIVFPNVNPDGVHWSHSDKSHAMWRKNRNPASSGGNPLKIGVDVNRNYDFLWDFPVAFAPGANPLSLASTDSASDLFHGTAPFSEPETRNVRWLFEKFPKIGWFMDVHSYGGDILYSWGDDDDQTTTPGMNFTNPAWNGKRGLPGDQYGEFIPPADLAEAKAAATAFTAALAGVQGQSYVVAQSFVLPGWGTYPTSGASDDWSYSRHFADPSKKKTFGFTLEFNKKLTFFPTWAEMEPIILDVDAGLVRFCLNAVPPGPAYLYWCWWRRFFYEAIWKRVFPPDLWGPYGPWGRILRVVVAVVNPVLAPIRQVLSTLFGKR
jgi:murein tripeptide amidase MpaA